MTTIHPGSELHRACDVHALKQSVGGVTAIKERGDRILPVQKESITEDYDLGYKGLLREPVVKTKPKEPKPELNVEDLDGDYS